MAATERFDFSKLRKEGDEYTARLLKIFEYPLGKLVIQYTALKPNQMSLISFIVGVSSIIVLIQGGYKYTLIGAALTSVYLLCDMLDGQIARVKGITSRFGKWIDGMLSFMLIPLMLLALGIGLKSYQGLLFGAIAALCFPLQFTFIYYYKAEIQEGIQRISIPGSKGIQKLRYVYGTTLFFPLLLIGAIINRPLYVLIFFAVFGSLYWMILLATITFNLWCDDAR